MEGAKSKEDRIGSYTLIINCVCGTKLKQPSNNYIKVCRQCCEHGHGYERDSDNDRKSWRSH